MALIFCLLPLLESCPCHEANCNLQSSFWNYVFHVIVVCFYYLGIWRKLWWIQTRPETWFLNNTHCLHFFFCNSAYSCPIDLVIYARKMIKCIFVRKVRRGEIREKASKPGNYEAKDTIQVLNIIRYENIDMIIFKKLGYG